MKSLQVKYNIVHILFFVTYVAVYGYIAIYLQYRGLSNTEIGIVTGGGAILSIFMSPFIASLIDRVKGLTIRKLILILYCIMFFLFLSLNFISSISYIIMLFYVLLTTLVTAVIPFLSVICMNYIKKGNYINFGLSRGFGSVSYAIGAVVIGQLISIFNPEIIAYIHLLFGILLIGLLYTLPDFEIEEKTKKEKTSSAFKIVKKYRTFFWILLGFGCMYAGATSLSTYLINIVKNLGGNTSLYGIAVFFMAASEMPVMTITYRLLKKYKSEILLFVAAIFYLLRNMIICMAPNLFVLIVGMIFQGLSYGLLTATVTYYVNDYLQEDDQMMGQTFIGIMTTGFGYALGSIMGGILQDYLRLSSMFVFVGIITFLGFMVMFLALRKNLFVKKI